MHPLTKQRPDPRQVLEDEVESQGRKIDDLQRELRESRSREEARGGQIDVPSYIAFQQTPLQHALPALAVLFLIHEALSVFTFNSPFGGELWSIRADYRSGDLGSALLVFAGSMKEGAGEGGGQ